MAAGVPAHFRRCAAALSGVGALGASVDGVPLDTDALAAAEPDDVEDVLRRAGWRPGLDAFENDIDFS